jgi:RNA polymerase sigma-70 factor (ECF subfamily)
MSDDVDAAIAAAFRADWGRVVANLIAITGDWDLAEESTQDAFTQALSTWRRDGLPDRPQAWLTTTARNRAVDRIRHDRVRAARLRDIATNTVEEIDFDGADHGIPDERLRLIYTCCHPAIAFESQVTLALRTLCGLTVAEIARSFLVTEAAMAKRLVRTRQKIAVARIPYRIPAAHQLPERTAAVLAVLYLLFHEGYAASHGPDLLRPYLCEQAIDLAGLVRDLVPDDPEAHGLYALMQLTHARADARTGLHGELIPLEAQDRSRWDRTRIELGLAALRTGVGTRPLGVYQLQALIAAVHATATEASATDWTRIAYLYDELNALAPSATIGLNRAIAVAMRDGPQMGLRELERLADADHPLVAATRADLLRRLGHLPEAAQAYRAAIDSTTNEAERAYLRRRLAECEAGDRR